MKKRIIVTSWIIVMSLILPCIVFAGSVLLTWEAGPEPDIAEYWIYYGTSTRVYAPPIPVGNVTSYTISGLDEGVTYYFSVTAVDTSENESGYSVERTVTMSDTIAPTVAITSPTTAGTYDTADALITISGNASDNVGVTSVTWANSAGGSGTASGTESWSISGISLVEGENIVTVTATDTAGNQNSASLAVTYTPPDTIAPTVAITSPTTAGTYDTADALITISGNASDNVGVTSVTWANSAGGSGTASGTESWSISGISLVEGENIVTVTATDTAGNQNSASLAVTYTPPDTIAPTVAITSPTTAGTYDTADALITISGNASDNVGVTSVTWANSAGGSGTASGTESWSISGISLVEGENIVTVTAADAAGNQNSASLAVTYTPPDTIAPTVAITSPTTAGTYDTADALITISGNASDNVGVTSVTWANSAGGSGTASGTESWSISGISLVEGENIVTVTATDTAGNQNSASLAVTYTAPQPLPVISDLTVASGTAYEVVDGLDNGSKAYVDSDSTYSYLPDALKNATYIKTSINDGTSTTKPFISFTVNKNVTVCIAYDDRIDSKPSWLPFKNKTTAKLGIGNKAMSIYARFFGAGRKVTLGGNEGDINSNMYTVIIVER